MSTPAPLSPSTADLVEEVAARVRRWLADAAGLPVDPAARRLAALLRDPSGLEFSVGFVDSVVRPEDTRVAARAFRRLSTAPPAFLSWPLRLAIRLGGLAAPVLPWFVVPAARRALRRMVHHLVTDANDPGLAAGLARVRALGARPNVNLLGEAVLGRQQAAARLAGTARLLARDDVDYVSIKVSATVAPHNPWAFDEAVADVVAALTPLFEQAAARGKFVSLDMEEYKDLDLTIAVFTEILDAPHLRGLEAGIVLQAYLPDAVGAYLRLRDWARARRAAGGAGIKVRLVKGANLPMELVDASLHDWPPATWATKRETDTCFKRVLDLALRPENVTDVRLGVAGHNLFDQAYAQILAARRGVQHRLDVEMLLGMAPAQAEAVRRDVGNLLLYTPVVAADDFDNAIAYLIRRLEEGASPENFMSAVFELDRDEALFARELERFRASLAALPQDDDEVPAPHRVQDRWHDEPPVAVPGTGFRNALDSDPSIAGNRAWARAAAGRAAASTLGTAGVEAARVDSQAAVDALLRAATGAAPGWAALGAPGRAAVLHRAGAALERRRGELVEVMMSEAGKTLDQGDPEVSEAVDFAHYYAEQALGLEHLDGAGYHPRDVTLVTPPWNFPLAIPAGSTLAALASGSAVVLKPARSTRRTAALLAEALWEGGVPRDVLQLAAPDDSRLSSALVSDPRVDQVILTGAYETAELFRGLRPGLRLFAETSGKNAIVVTPSADLDLAARDLAASAFGHAGQKCSAASLAILVGSVATSARFRGQLLDAVDAMTVGQAWDPASRIGPLIGPAQGKLLSALTQLGPGERWLRQPRQLDPEGRLWSPGVKTVVPGSEYHYVEYFGPVLGILAADSLEQATEYQNAVAYGLTAGLHSLDEGEVARWLDAVRAGNLYVNRGITGAIVRRQPFGGWKRSVVGPGAKAGGPNYLLALGEVRRTQATAPLGEPLVPQVAAVVAAFGGSPFLARSAASDRAAWHDELGVVRDVTGLTAERNAFRYLPVPVTVRAAAGADPEDVARVLVAGLAAHAPVRLSTAVPLPAARQAAVAAAGIGVRVEDDEAWVQSLAAARDVRVRLVGGDAEALLTALGGRPDVTVYDHPVTEAGRVELLPFLREQAVAITAHRFGNPSRLVDAIPLTPGA